MGWYLMRPTVFRTDYRAGVTVQKKKQPDMPHDDRFRKSHGKRKKEDDTKGIVVKIRNHKMKKIMRQVQHSKQSNTKLRLPMRIVSVLFLCLHMGHSI